MLVVDTSVWVDYFNGVKNLHTDYLHAALETTPIIIGDLILAEILQGFRNDRDFEVACRLLGRFIQESMVTPERAVQSARNYRFLRQRGITVRKTIDSLIAAYCIECGHQLLHNDSGFDGYEKHLGLQVIHP